MRDINAILKGRVERERTQSLLAIYGGLQSAVGRQGAVLTGLSLKLSEFDTLLTLRGDFPAGSMISFVAAEDIPGVLCKAVREANADKLTWREDNYSTKVTLSEEE